MSHGSPHVMTLPEYRNALRADHGTVRRFLAGCRCSRCSTPAHYRYREEQIAEATRQWRARQATERAEEYAGA